MDLTRTVLRECARDDAVRSSVISIGALALANRGPRPSADAYDLSKANQTAWRHAVVYHTKAISLFRTQLSSFSSSSSCQASSSFSTPPPPSPRSILILSTLFILFELAQGNTSAVDKLTSSTLSALQTPLNLTADTTSASHIPGGHLDDDIGIKGLENLFFLSTTYTGFALPVYTAQTRLISTLDIAPLKAAVSLDRWEPARDKILSLRDAMTQWEAFVGRATLWGIRCSAIVARTGRDIDDAQSRAAQERFAAHILEWEGIVHASMAHERRERGGVTTEGAGEKQIRDPREREASLAWLELLYGINVLYAFIASALAASECRFDPYVERYRVGVDMVEKRIMAILVKQQQGQAVALRSKSAASSTPSLSAHTSSRSPTGQTQDTTPTDTDQGNDIPITPSLKLSTSSSPALPTSSEHSQTATHPQRPSQERTHEIPTQSFPMPVLNSRLLQSLCVTLRACRDRALRLRLLALCKIVVNPGSTWDDKATFIGSKVFVELEEAKRRPLLHLATHGGERVVVDGTADICSSGRQRAMLINESAGTDEARVAALDLSTAGVPENVRLRWEHAEWSPGCFRLKLVFVNSISGEEVVINLDSRGEYGHLMT